VNQFKKEDKMSDETPEINLPQEISLPELASIAAMFNEIARRSFQDQPSADAGNDLFDASKAELSAARAGIDAFKSDVQEQVAILEGSAPALDPAEELADAVAQFGIDASQLDDAAKAEIAEELGIDLNAKPDSPEIAEAKKLAFSTAQDTLNEIMTKMAPAAIKYEELRASLLVQVLPTQIFNSVADRIVPPEYLAEINAAFTANNAPILASAFTPKQA
jgi:hypothetical protein